MRNEIRIKVIDFIQIYKQSCTNFNFSNNNTAVCLRADPFFFN